MAKGTKESVLIIGGSGVVGTHAAKALRKLHPGLSITIGGRNVEKAAALARELGNADAVEIDLGKRDLGLAGDKVYGAVLMFVKDPSLNALEYAQDTGAAYVDLMTTGFEIAPEIAVYAQRPNRSAIVFAGMWLAGAALFPTLHFATAYEHLESIAIGAVLDEQDMGGPAAASDYERIMGVIDGSHILEDGKWVWVKGEEHKRTFVTVDGSEVEAQPYSVLDNLSLAAATDARAIRFDFVLGESATRRRGEPFSTEFVIELTGTKKDGSKGRSRHEFFHPQGQAPVTGLSAAVIVERLLGLVGAPVPPGLYLPNLFIEPKHMLERLASFGAQIRTV